MSLQLAVRSEVVEFVARYNLFTESLEVPDPSRGSVVTEQAKPSVRILDVYAERCQETVISMCNVRGCRMWHVLTLQESTKIMQLNNPCWSSTS